MSLVSFIEISIAAMSLSMGTLVRYAAKQSNLVLITFNLSDKSLIDWIGLEENALTLLFELVLF